MLRLSQYLIKEHVGMFKLTDAFDIIDPATGAKVGLARENIPGWTKFLRLLVNKRMLPTRVDIQEAEEGPAVATLRRGFTFLRAQVHVQNQSGNAIGYFRAKLMTLGGGFFVHDASGKQIAEVKGDWKGWNFKLIGTDGSEWGTVSKQLGGLGKELFTSADNYIIALNPRVGSDPTLATLLLAAGLAIDTVFKENQG